jgi:hypothetical protein
LFLKIKGLLRKSNLTKPFSSVSHKAGEGVPYETVLKTESNSEQILPIEADVVVLGTVYHNFFII